jgi:hypothetical protein
MSGTVVFSGTRVPFQTLIDYIEAGQPLSEFLEDFPTVSSEQAIAVDQASVAQVETPATKVTQTRVEEPSSITIMNERSCEEIAVRFCSRDRWREFTDHNNIRVYQVGKRWVCEIFPGRSYELPPKWRSEGCS